MHVRRFYVDFPDRFVYSILSFGPKVAMNSEKPHPCQGVYFISPLSCKSLTAIQDSHGSTFQTYDHENPMECCSEAHWEIDVVIHRRTDLHALEPPEPIVPSSSDLLH